MKKILSVLLVVMLLAFSLAACSGGEKAPAAEGTASGSQTTSNAGTSTNETKDTIVIGFAQQFTSEFMQSVLTGCYEAIEEINAKGGPKIDFKLVNAESDPDKQNTQVETFIAQEVDAIILNPVDASSNAVAVENAIAAGIPIITVNCQTKNQDKATAYSGCDDVEAGRLMMQRFVDKLGQNAKVVCINGATGHSAQIQRKQGLDEILAKYPTVELVAELGGVWGTEPAQRNIENLIEGGKVFQAVATHSDEQAKGVINAVQAAGFKPGEILIGGVDGNFYALDYIEQGWQDCTLYQNGLEQGSGSIRLAYAAALGEKVEDNVVPYILVSAENLQEMFDHFEERDALIAKYFK